MLVPQEKMVVLCGGGFIELSFGKSMPSVLDDRLLN